MAQKGSAMTQKNMNPSPTLINFKETELKKNPRINQFKLEEMNETQLIQQQQTVKMPLFKTTGKNFSVVESEIIQTISIFYL